MNIAPIFALVLSSGQPLPIGDANMLEIGCVAVIGIIAHEQRSGADALQKYADVRESGKKWAGIVGDRIMAETGQPREVVALAFKAAVEAEQEKSWKLDSADKSAAHVLKRFDQCKPVMDGQLAAAAGTTPSVDVGNGPSMLAAEPKLATDEPDRITLYRQQLGEDLASPHRIRICGSLLEVSAGEISDREGRTSRDAKAFGRLAKAVAAKVRSLPNDGKSKFVSAEELLSKQKAEPEREDVIARCIRLAESLALATPPE